MSKGLRRRTSGNGWSSMGPGVLRVTKPTSSEHCVLRITLPNAAKRRRMQTLRWCNMLLLLPQMTMTLYPMLSRPAGVTRVHSGVSRRRRQLASPCDRHLLVVYRVTCTTWHRRQPARYDVAPPTETTCLLFLPPSPALTSSSSRNMTNLVRQDAGCRVLMLSSSVGDATARQNKTPSSERKPFSGFPRNLTNEILFDCFRKQFSKLRSRRVNSSKILSR